MTITNTGLILPGLASAQLYSYQTYGEYGILGISAGAAGQNGGLGGSSQAAGVTINNSGEIAITNNNAAISGGTVQAGAGASAIVDGAAGIAAVAMGGAGSNSGNVSPGGNAGNAAVTNSATVFGNYTGQGTLANGLYGILARSAGGAGGSVDGQAGYDGGSAGTAAITLNNGTVVDLYLNDGNNFAVPASPNAAVSAASIGGAGGIALNGNGKIGGSGGAANMATVIATDADIATSAAVGGALPGILALSQGGGGGCAGSQFNGDVGYYPSNPDTACTANDSNPSQNGGEWRRGRWRHGKRHRGDPASDPFHLDRRRR